MENLSDDIDSDIDYFYELENAQEQAFPQRLEEHRKKKVTLKENA